MMKNKIYLLAFICVFAFSACGEDEDDAATASVDCSNFATEIQEESQKLITAATNYQTDPVGNCSAYLTALDDYLDAVTPFVEKCGDDETFAQFKAGIDQYKSVRNQITCN